MELVEVADGILAAVQPSVGFGAVNSAAVIEDDGITVIDACTVPSQDRAGDPSPPPTMLRLMGLA